jgi:hypothetical protein
VAGLSQKKFGLILLGEPFRRSQCAQYGLDPGLGIVGKRIQNMCTDFSQNLIPLLAAHTLQGSIQACQVVFNLLISRCRPGWSSFYFPLKTGSTRTAKLAEKSFHPSAISWARRRPEGVSQ